MEPTAETLQPEATQSPQQALLQADATAFPAFWQNLQNQNVLLVGWGTGKLAESLLDKGNTVTCIEASADLISKAREFTDTHPIHMIHADLANAAEDSGHAKFPVVITSLVAEPVRDLARFFKQVTSLLSLHGTFYISEIHPESAPPANHIHHEETVNLTAQQTGLDLERTEIFYGSSDLRALTQMWEYHLETEFPPAEH